MGTYGDILGKCPLPKRGKINSGLWGHMVSIAFWFCVQRKRKRKKRDEILILRMKLMRKQLRVSMTRWRAWTWRIDYCYCGCCCCCWVSDENLIGHLVGLPFQNHQASHHSC